MVASCQATCVQLLVTLGKIHAEAAGQALVSMLEACLNPDASNPAEGLTEQIVESLCRVAASCGHHNQIPRCALQIPTSTCFACRSDLFTAGPAPHTCAPGVGADLLNQLHATCQAADEAFKSWILCTVGHWAFLRLLQVPWRPFCSPSAFRQMHLSCSLAK